MKKQRGLGKQKWAVETGPSVRRLKIVPPQGPGIAVGDVCAADMTPRDGRPWLPVALLFLQGPGCWCLSGPTSVTGTVGGSLSVQCQYEEKFREIAKYWCKSPCVWSTVKTKEADREVRNGRVSIRDHPANLTFTVTLESLTEDDAGTYRCGIDTSSGLPGFVFDHTFRVVVSVTPGPSSVRPTSIPGLHRTQPAPTWGTATLQETPNPRQYLGSLLGSVHFLLLILLKVPLFLIMLSAVLWVNRPQWAVCGTQSRPDEDNLRPSLSIDILSRDTATQTRGGRTAGPKPTSSHLLPKTGKNK
ncbi:protein CD300H-like isoform X2 [Neomonachus schauinslandi]|uniref:Protein CD300H-like isoform X2 n=1 Tax=Neomonachus schauinslandi TaxID=29088 RepID=A0A8M1M5D4_NEOSC|nr:protein CD300H-like isoform X2 [Neomonachus schauinslandi]XP_044768213.1 protein CD300H-like isoform X2 [Neomonachus schauinslandi]XP_044768215.1 protein CD300H-like isoform X2 [Neomonachus schauinslandi]